VDCFHSAYTVVVGEDGALSAPGMVVRTVWRSFDCPAWGTQPYMYLPTKTDPPTRTLETRT